MTSGEGQMVSEAQLLRALRPELPDAGDMAKRVRVRLAERTAAHQRPQGVLLRIADWTGLKGVAASIVGPVLVPLGLARTGTVGALAAKGLLPKSLLSTLALPFAFLMVIGLTLHLSLRRTTNLESDNGVDVDMRAAASKWWSEHMRSAWMMGGILLVMSFFSYATVRVCLILVGIVALALCAEGLSRGRTASRHAVTTAAFNIAWSVYVATHLASLVADMVKGNTGAFPSEFEFSHLVLELATTAWTIALMTLAWVQGRSRFLRPWALMVKGTDRDIAKLAAVALLGVSTPGLVLALGYYVQSWNGSVGEGIWDSRASLAWVTYCLHALVVVKRAPVTQSNGDDA